VRLLEPDISAKRRMLSGETVYYAVAAWRCLATTGKTRTACRSTGLKGRDARVETGKIMSYLGKDLNLPDDQSRSGT
jgi:hypothetical protein